MFCSNTKGGFYVRHFKTNLIEGIPRDCFWYFFAVKWRLTTAKEVNLRNISAFVA